VADLQLRILKVILSYEELLSAIYTYNHASWHVSDVLALAARYAATSS
jgi:hypothetical protein